jgi:hypothetical protein
MEGLEPSIIDYRSITLPVKLHQQFYYLFITSKFRKKRSPEIQKKREETMKRNKEVKLQKVINNLEVGMGFEPMVDHS